MECNTPKILQAKNRIGFHSPKKHHPNDYSMRCFHRFAHIWLPSLRIKTYRLLHGWATRKDTWFFVGGVFGCWKISSNPGDQRTEGMQVNSDPPPPRKTSTQNSTKNHPLPKAHPKKTNHIQSTPVWLFWTCVFEKNTMGVCLDKNLTCKPLPSLGFRCSTWKQAVVTAGWKFGVPLLNSRF